MSGEIGAPAPTDGHQDELVQRSTSQRPQEKEEGRQQQQQHVAYNSDQAGPLPGRTPSVYVGSQIEKPQEYSTKRKPWQPRSTPFKEIAVREYPGEGTEEKPFIISWLPQDPENPQTFATAYKWFVTLEMAIVTLAVALASSAYSGGIRSVIIEFRISEEVAILGVSLFVVGFALGPLIWAPLSEMYGRRRVLIFTYTMFTIWQAVSPASQNIQSLIIFRFLAGSFGSSPLTNAGGVLADMFGPKERGMAMSLFAAAPFLGPSLGPIVGGFLGEAAGWRWVEGLLAIFSGVLTIISFLFAPETYAPTLLRRRAAKLSKLTGKVYRAPMDAEKKLDPKELFKTSLGRPWKLLFLEPIVLLLSLYMAIVYGTLYMLFAAFPVVYQEGRGWSPGIGGLAFLGVLVGMIFAVTYSIFYDNPRYVRVMEANGGRAPPEARLPPAMFGGALLVIGLAWFAASDGPNTHWIVSIIGSTPFGWGMVLVFLALMNYLIDTYSVFAASVLAGNSVLRSLFGAAFPLFTTQMFHNLGVHWGAAVPGFLALACLPFPFLFYIYGARIRDKCKYSKQADQIVAKMMAQSQKGPSAPEKKPTQDAEHKAEEFPAEAERTQESRSAHSDSTLAESQDPNSAKANSSQV